MYIGEREKEDDKAIDGGRERNRERRRRRGEEDI